MRIQMDLQDKRVLVVGTGISGIAAAELLVANNIAVDIFDAAPQVTAVCIVICSVKNDNICCENLLLHHRTHIIHIQIKRCRINSCK